MSSSRLRGFWIDSHRLQNDARFMDDHGNITRALHNIHADRIGSGSIASFPVMVTVTCRWPGKN